MIDILKNVCVIITGTSVGAFFGITLSFIMVATLTLISATMIFNLYVGGTFLFLGGMMLLKLYRKNKLVAFDLGIPAGAEEPEGQSLIKKEEKSANKGGLAADLLHTPLALVDSKLCKSDQNNTINNVTYYLEYAMAVTNFLSGAFCFILEKEWFSKIDDDMKIPLYAMIGSSLAFAVNYTVVDVVIILLEFCHYDLRKRSKAEYTPLVVSNLQHFFLLIATVILGVIFGALYGLTDIETLYEVKVWMLEAALFIEVFIFAPLGLLMGGIIGFWFTVIRIKELEKKEEEK